MAVSILHEVTDPDPANAASYVTPSFTPQANDVLVAFAVATATVAAGTMTSSVGGQTFSRVTTATKASGADTMYMFVSDQLVSSASQTVTFDCTGDNASSCSITVISLTGMNFAGLGCVRQYKTISNQASSTPSLTFDATVDSAGCSVGCVFNASNPAGLTAPTSWAENADSGQASPTAGIHVVSADTGVFSGSTVTWQSSSSAFGAIIAELQPTKPLSRRPTITLQAVSRGANI